MNMSAKDSVRAWIAGICWLVGLLTYAIVIVIAVDGTSSFPTKSIIAFSLISGIPQAIGHALSLGYGYVGGKRCAVVWGIGVASSVYLALSYSASAALVDFAAWGIFMILAQLFTNKKSV